MSDALRNLSRESRKIYLATFSVSILFALISTNTLVDSFVRESLRISIPTANLLDRVSGDKSHTFYYVGMLAFLPILIARIWKILRFAIRGDSFRLMLSSACFFVASVAAFYFFMFLPEDYAIRGGRLSMLIGVAAKSWIFFGIVYALIFLAAAVFFGLFLLSFSCAMNGGSSNDCK